MQRHYVSFQTTQTEAEAKNFRVQKSMSVDYKKNKEQIIQEFLKGGDSTIETKTNRLDDSYLDDFKPLEIKVFNNAFDRAFRAFRTLVQKEKILSLYKQKQSYEKPSVKRRRKANEQRQKQMELESRRLKILSGEFDKELQKKLKLKEIKKQERDERMRQQQRSGS